MGSFDRAEFCELIGIYIQSILAKLTSKNGMGIYGEDALKNKNGQQRDRIR